MRPNCCLTIPSMWALRLKESQNMKKDFQVWFFCDLYFGKISFVIDSWLLETMISFGIVCYINYSWKCLFVGHVRRSADNNRWIIKFHQHFCFYLTFGTWTCDMTILKIWKKIYGLYHNSVQWQYDYLVENICIIS